MRGLCRGRHPGCHDDRAVAADPDAIYPLTDQGLGSRDYAVRDVEGFVWALGTYVMAAPED